MVYISARSIDAAAIAPYLWQGGVEAYEGRRIGFYDVDHVAFLAPDAGVLIESPRPIMVPLQDHASDLNYLPELHDLASYLAHRVIARERVLILCRQGRNRSGLLTGLVLNQLGVPGRKAVARIRSKRRNALSTPAFAKYLATLP